MERRHSPNVRAVPETPSRAHKARQDRLRLSGPRWRPQGEKGGVGRELLEGEGGYGGISRAAAERLLGTVKAVGRLLAVENAVGAGIGEWECLWGTVRAGVLGGRRLPGDFKRFPGDRVWHRRGDSNRHQMLPVDVLVGSPTSPHLQSSLAVGQSGTARLQTHDSSPAASLPQRATPSMLRER